MLLFTTAILVSIPFSDNVIIWNADATSSGVSVSAGSGWEKPESAPAGIDIESTLPTLPAPSAVPSTPHHLCEFENLNGCLWE